MNCWIRFIILYFFLHPSAHADWNEEFDAQSAMLVKHVPSLRNRQYLNEYKFFKSIREILVNDPLLIKELQEVALDRKLRIINETSNVIIKKRFNNKTKDLYPWELSYLLKGDKYILPSFPMEIGGTHVIVQKLEAFEYGAMIGNGYTEGTLEKVSLETYWKANILAYILGFWDLAAPNIGVNPKGIIRFFDNESCLVYFDTPFRGPEMGFTVGFISHSFDWNQFTTPLDKSTAAKLKKYIKSLKNFEKELSAYLKFRPINFENDGIHFRLNLLRNFNFKKGISFYDLYSVIYPRITLGFEELIDITRKGLNREDIGYGTALFFCSYLHKRFIISEEVSEDLRHWIDTYIE